MADDLGLQLLSDEIKLVYDSTADSFADIDKRLKTIEGWIKKLKKDMENIIASRLDMNRKFDEFRMEIESDICKLTTIFLDLHYVVHGKENKDE